MIVNTRAHNQRRNFAHCRLRSQPALCRRVSGRHYLPLNIADSRYAMFAVPSMIGSLVE